MQLEFHLVFSALVELLGSSWSCLSFFWPFNIPVRIQTRLDGLCQQLSPTSLTSRTVGGLSNWPCKLKFSEQFTRINCYPKKHISDVVKLWYQIFRRIKRTVCKFFFYPFVDFLCHPHRKDKNDKLVHIRDVKPVLIYSFDKLCFLWVIPAFCLSLFHSRLKPSCN